MPRVGRGHRRADGALMFLESLQVGLAPPELPGARCARRDHDPELWFPANGDRAAAKRAKAICWSCPVRAACLEWALGANERTGIWGGTTPNERRELRRAAARARATQTCRSAAGGVRRRFLNLGRRQLRLADPARAGV